MAAEHPQTRSAGADEPAAGRPRKPRRESRLARHARQARMVWDDPRSLGRLLRGALLDLWRARGGGLFGLGYVVTFVFLEVRLVVSEFAGSDSLLAFIESELLEYLLRLGIMSFVNVLLALLWPVLLLDRLGAWGLLLLPAAYLAFERWLRPGVEARFPELRRGAAGSD